MIRLNSNIVFAAVLLVGALQIIGYTTGNEAIRKVGQLTAASPLPLVFSHFRGLETFSSRFGVTVTDATGQETIIPITPELYSQFPGPYNRRNVYGAAIAYGVVLDKPEEKKLVSQVLSFAFCPNGPLRAHLENLRQMAVGNIVSIVVTPKGGAENRLVVECPT